MPITGPRDAPIAVPIVEHVGSIDKIGSLVAETNLSSNLEPSLAPMVANIDAPTEEAMVLICFLTLSIFSLSDIFIGDLPCLCLSRLLRRLANIFRNLLHGLPKRKTKERDKAPARKKM